MYTLPPPSPPLPSPPLPSPHIHTHHRNLEPNRIQCRTSPGQVNSSALVVVSIDAATVSNPGVMFNYLSNPNVTGVFPSNTIPRGGIILNFTGVGLDVVQQPVLEIYLPDNEPQVHIHNMLQPTCTHMYTHTHTHICTCTSVHTHTHLYRLTHTHTL